MGWDRHKLLWDGNGTDKYVPWTTLHVLCRMNKAHRTMPDIFRWCIKITSFQCGIRYDLCFCEQQICCAMACPAL